MIQGYLLSLLARQRALLEDRFDARYPHAWLVWEPGPRLKPQTPEDLETGQTRMPKREPMLHPVADDAVCFPVPPLTDGASFLTVGRQEECSITIDDMSVSREHARLHPAREGWALEPSGPVQTLVDGMPVPPGTRAPLTNACTIVLGSVRLTYYQQARFSGRLNLEEKRQVLDQLR